jgi:hypothetical protein
MCRSGVVSPSAPIADVLRDRLEQPTAPSYWDRLAGLFSAGQGPAVMPPDPSGQSMAVLDAARRWYDWRRQMAEDPEALAAAGGVSGPRFMGNLFHGSPRTNLTSIRSTPRVRQFDNPSSRLGAFFTPDEAEAAARYAGTTGRVYPKSLTLEKPYEMTWGEFRKFQDPHKAAEGATLPWEQWTGRVEELRREAIRLRARLTREGHDGIIVRNSKGEPIEVVSFKDVALP